MLKRCEVCGDIIPEYCELCDSCFRLEEEEELDKLKDEDWEREYYEEL